MSAEPEKSKSDTRVVIRNIGFLPTGYHLSIPRFLETSVTAVHI